MTRGSSPRKVAPHGQLFRIVYAVDGDTITPLTIIPITGFPITRRGLCGNIP
jgi:hypothetical protein